MLKSKTYDIIYGVILYYLLFYILPIISLSYMTFALIRALRRSHIKARAVLGGDVGRSKAREEITLSLIIVVFVFMICQFSAPARRIIMVIYHHSRQCPGPLFYINAFALVSYKINSASNFFIFILCAKRFRSRVFALFKCCRGKVHPSSDVQPSTSSNTATKKSNSTTEEEDF